MAHTIGLELHGARAAVTVSNDSLVGSIEKMAPFGTVVGAPVADAARFALRTRDGRHVVIQETGAEQSFDYVQEALDVLGSYLLLYLMGHATEVLYVHATAVAHRGRAIVLPGRMGTGKSVLTMALLRAGAVFYSDDWLPIDARGNVHPYPVQPWVVDLKTGRYGRRDLVAMGVEIGAEPVPVGVLAHVVHKPRAELQLLDASSGKGVLLLLDNAFGTHQQPELAMTAARHAAAGARVLEGHRDDADEAAAALLARL